MTTSSRARQATQEAAIGRRVEQLVKQIQAGTRGTGGTAPRRGEPVPGTGLKVRFSRLKGETPRGILTSPFAFQMSPTDPFSIQTAFAHSDYEALDGERSRPGSRRLTRFTLSTLMVDYDTSWAAYHYGTSALRRRATDPDFPAPGHDRPSGPLVTRAPEVDLFGWISELLELQETGRAFNVTIGQPELWGRWDVRQLPMTLRSLTVEERPDEDDTRYLAAELAEFRRQDLDGSDGDHELPAVVSIDEHGQASWTDDDGFEQTLPDVTLGRLAKEFYGVYGEWRAIAKSGKNRRVRSSTANDHLSSVAVKHGTGKTGHRVLKVTIPKIEIDGPLLGTTLGLPSE